MVQRVEHKKIELVFVMIVVALFAMLVYKFLSYGFAHYPLLASLKESAISTSTNTKIETNTKTTQAITLKPIQVSKTTIIDKKPSSTMTPKQTIKKLTPAPVPVKQAPVVKQVKEPKPKPKIKPASSVLSFSDSFNKSGTLKDGWKMSKSKSSDWWLNSGGYLYYEGGVAHTIFGILPEDDERRHSYNNYNPKDTDDGYRPQNIFRLVTRSKWSNFIQEAYYKINTYNIGKSDKNSESNGLLLFNRYDDSDNLYYAGVRVDGAAVIKKKIHGEYFTMKYKKIFQGHYSKETKVSLLPTKEWIGVRTKLVDLPNGTVEIVLYLDLNRTGTWEEVLRVIDDGKSFGGGVIKNGYAGIRTDFMDVSFDDYKIIELSQQ